MAAGNRETGLAKRDGRWAHKFGLAVEAGKKRNYRLASKILGELISESDAPVEAWLLLGRAFHALGDYSHALACFNDYLKLRPRSGQGCLFTGRTYLTLGLPYKAVPFLRRALEYNPGDHQVMALLGAAYLKSKHSQAAVDLLEEAVKAAPENKRIYRAYLNALFVRGIRLCRLEEYDLGIQMLRFVLKNAGTGPAGSPLLALELGKACRETGRLEEALEHYSRAVKLAPEDRRIRWARASILLALGRNREALAEIDRIRKQEPGVPELPWNSELVDLFMIRSFLEAGAWRRAAEACRNWLRRAGTRTGTVPASMVHALYAEALQKLRNYSSAHNHLRRALEEKPDELEFHYADILVCWEGKDWKALKKALREAKAAGGDPNLIKRFSILLEARTSDDVKATLARLQDAVRTMGPEPELMYALGEANLKAGFLDHALGWFDKTLILLPDHEEARLGKIAVLEALEAEDSAGNTGALGTAYNEYLKRWPDNFSIRRERAIFLVRTCEYAQAAGELEKLLVFEPSNPSLRRVLAYTYRKTGRCREAAVFLKALLKERPRDMELLIEYSGCLERAGAPDYAEAVLEKARELFQQSPEICLALGILNFRNGKIEAAFDYLREAAALNTKDPRPYEWMAAIARKTGSPGGGRYYEEEAQKRKRKT